MPILQVNGVPLAYTDTGAPADRPDAPPIVFGHGLLFSGWLFSKQIEALRDRFRCVTIDWRGQGDARSRDVPTPVAKARRIADQIPGARLEIVPDAGHSSPLEQPEEITRLIEELLTTV